MKKIYYIIKNIGLPLVIILGGIAIWELVVKVNEIPLYVLPPPSKIVITFINEFDLLFNNGIVTFKETIIGMSLAALLGMTLAITMDYFKTMKRAIYPILVFSQTLPIIILAPLFIIYFGFGMTPKILTVVLMCFFVIVVHFSTGMSQVSINQINLVKAFGGNPIQVYTKVKIPGAAKSLFAALKVSATYSVTGAVVGEFLSSSEGLGYYMMRVSKGYVVDKVFACILAIAIIALLMNGIVRLLEYICIPHLRGSSNNPA